MSEEMLKEFIGKECRISDLNGWSAVTGIIVAQEDGWIKVEEKNRIRMMNLAYVKDIAIKR